MLKKKPVVKKSTNPVKPKDVKKPVVKPESKPKEVKPSTPKADSSTKEVKKATTPVAKPEEVPQIIPIDEPKVISPEPEPAQQTEIIDSPPKIEESPDISAPTPPVELHDIKTPPLPEDDAQPAPTEEIAPPTPEKGPEEEPETPKISIARFFNPVTEAVSPCEIGLLGSFKDVEDKTLTEYVFSNCPIVSFEGLETLENAESINLANCLCTTFRGVTKMPKLQKIWLHGSPLSFQRHYRIMTLYAFGTQLIEIDGIPVSKYEKHVIEKCRDHELEISKFVRTGNIIHSDLTPEYVKIICKRVIPQPELSLEMHPNETGANLMKFWTKDEFKAAEMEAYKQVNVGGGAKGEIARRRELRQLDSFIRDITSTSVNKRITELSKFCNVSALQESVKNHMNSCIQSIYDRIVAVLEKIPSDGMSVYGQFKFTIGTMADVVDSLKKRQVDDVVKGAERLHNVPRRDIFKDIIARISAFHESVNMFVDTVYSYSGVVDRLEAKLAGNMDALIILRSCSPLEVILPKLRSILDGDAHAVLDLEVFRMKIHDKLRILLSDASVYIKMLGKSAICEYLNKLCDVYTEISRELSDEPELKDEITTSMNYIHGIEDLCRYTSCHIEEIQSIFQSVPAMNEIDEMLETAQKECLLQVKDFYATQVLPRLEQEIQDMCDSSNEYVKARVEIRNNAETVAAYLASISKWKQDSESSRSFVRDVCSAGQFTSIRPDLIENGKAYDEMEKLEQLAQEKEAEIARLKQQLNAC